MPIPHLKHPSSQAPQRWRQRSVSTSPTSWRLRFNWWRVFFVLIIVGSLIGIATIAWVSRDLPTPDGIARRIIPQSTKIYDRTGKILLYDLHGEQRRTSVPLNSIPNYLKWATIAVEDKNFYQHSGFQFTSMVRALLTNLIKGGKAQGGSTITQQLIKNAILTNEKTYTRKIKELILAYQIENKFSKDEILQLYFNEIPYGSNAYGADAAAQIFFGKSVKDLTLAESAALAALPKSTTRLSPWGTHKDELIARQQLILDLMVNQNYIKPEEAEAAKKETLNFLTRRESIIAPHFIFYIKDILAEKYGERMVEEGGLKITTTLDVDKQKMAENAIAASANKNKSYNAQNASLVAIDVPNNQILALVGSRDYFDDSIAGQVNVALRPRQPGSSFKPIVYVTAFGLGFTPETKLFDVVTNFKTDTKDYSPHDYDDKERGPISLRQALAGSLNIPAVKLLYLTGIDKVLETAGKLGYTTLNDRSRFGLSLVLGGAEVKLLEHTASFATIAREGIKKPIISIIKVEDSNGNVLEEYKPESGERVLEQQPVRILTSILSDNNARSFIFGAQNYLTLPDRPVAAKTGTTNDFRDAWTMGFTPQLAVGVWVGNSDNAQMKKGADGSLLAAPIWNSFLKQASAGSPVLGFMPPDPQPTTKPILRGELGEEIIIDSTTGQLANDSTLPENKISKFISQYHTILKYITPGDPLGPPPNDPSKDPQFTNWEEAINVWVNSHGFKDDVLPNTNTNSPQINIISPTVNQIINSGPIPIIIQTVSKNISKIKLWLDDKPISELSQSPYNFLLPISNDWADGVHILKAEAIDNWGNTEKTEVVFTLLIK